MEKVIFERIVAEYDELSKKTLKLRDFLLDTTKSDVLDHLNKDLLIIQLKAMEAYLSTLSVRIGLNAPREDSMEQDAEIVSE